MFSATDLMEYISYCHKATYPDVAAFEPERDVVEAAWPAYADYKGLCRTPALLRRYAAKAPEAQVDAEEAAQWCQLYDAHYQEVAERMLRHVRPYNHATGERNTLSSCKRKDKPGECRGGFP